MTRPDLLDRSIVITLDPIPDDRRRSESLLDAAFQQAHPAILAALLDGVVTALSNEAITTLNRLPRMADFATWIVAAAPSIDVQPDEFLTAFNENQQSALEGVLDGDVVADTIMNTLKLPWTGQLKDLLEQIPEHEHKPKSARGLRSALRRKAPALRRVGITMTFEKGHVKTVTLSRTSDPRPLFESVDDRHFADGDTEIEQDAPF